jgi:hypothetical protein
VFGKAYSLVTSYFDRDLVAPAAPALQLPLTAGGALVLAFSSWIPRTVAAAGAVAWAVGVAVFVGTLGWTVRDNPTGAETATGEADADRRPVDRAASAFVPVALPYLLVGAYETAAVRTALPSVLAGYGPQASHLLAAGGAAVMVFAVGFRLLPRFAVATPPRHLVRVVLPAGALAPAMIAAGIFGGPVLHAGAAVEALAVCGFAVAVAALLCRTDRDRVGFHGVGAGAAAGLAGVALGAWFAFVGRDPGLTVAHYRLTLLGFLGTTIVGVAYQFYPPAVGGFLGADDRTALASIAALAAGPVVETGGWAVGSDAAITGGRVLALAGSVLCAGLLWGLFADRYWT